jgi:cobalt-zinc-cadmium efflux system outer membrane protein
MGCIRAGHARAYSHTQRLRGAPRVCAASRGTSLETSSRVRLKVLIVIACVAVPARADVDLPNPLRAQDVATLARSRRSEIVAARARARAAAQRPTIVSALDEPTVSFSLDHIPLNLMGVDANLTVEQAFPLSRIRGHRKRSAEAGLRRELANADRVALDVELDAQQAFWMLGQLRAAADIVNRQQALAKQLEAAALARYSANTGAQSDVLRAQTETARLTAEQRAFAAEIRAAEVMLNTTLARDPLAPIPKLDTAVPDGDPPASDAVARSSVRRPELRAGRAEIEQAEAEVRVMRSMYAPMAMVRTGPAYTMAEGEGWMVMVGISIPLWRGKLRAGVAEADAMVDMATADLDAMRRMAEGEARSARENVVAARERYVALRDDILPRAEQAIAPTLASYSSGQVPLVSVVEAAQALWMAQRDLVVARAQLGIAWARLRRATGQEVTP